MTPQQEQEYLRYVHTHGKVVRCWHERECVGSKYCVCGAGMSSHEDFCCVEDNPTLTLDYLIQRCEENGFDFQLERFFKDVCIARIFKSEDTTPTSSSDADMPQHALLIALYKALGGK